MSNFPTSTDARKWAEYCLGPSADRNLIEALKKSLENAQLSVIFAAAIEAGRREERAKWILPPYSHSLNRGWPEHVKAVMAQIPPTPEATE